MKTIEREIVVIGAGPAGLCAAIEAARAGAQVMLVDENSRPGGQLFKQQADTQVLRLGRAHGRHPRL